VGDHDTLVIGVGRSPIIFIEFLREKHDLDVDYLPISYVASLSPQKIFNGLTPDESKNLDQYFWEVYRRWNTTKKRIVLVDWSNSGATLRFLAREFSRFLRENHLPHEVVVGSVQEKGFPVFISPSTKHFHILSKDRPVTSFRVRDQAHGSTLMTSIRAGAIDWFAPHPKVDVRRILGGDDSPDPENYMELKHELYPYLQRAVIRHSRKDPYLSPTAKPQRIHDMTRVDLLTQSMVRCSSLLSRVGQYLSAKLVHPLRNRPPVR